MDKKLIIDLSTNPAPGNTFLGLGTAIVRAIVKNLKAGQTYDIEVRADSADFAARRPPFPCWGGVRVGGMKLINDDNAIGEAVQLAKESDGECFIYLGLSS